MIVTTTPSVEGKTIIEHKGIVFGEVITGVNFVKDIGAGLRDIFGGRSEGYESELVQARQQTLQELINNAEKIGANAVVGIDFDYEVLGSTMLMVTAAGTAVVVK